MKSLALQNLQEAFLIRRATFGPFVDESGIKLNQTCSGANFLPGIFGGEYAAHADDWQRATRQAIKSARRLDSSVAARRAAQSALAAGRNLRIRC